MSQVINQNNVDQLLANQPLNFVDALFLMSIGKKLRRSHLDLRYIAIQKPDENSKMKHAYFFAAGKDHNPFPYQITANDIFAKDWQVV